MKFSRPHFVFDPEEGQYVYTGPIKSPNDIWRSITVGVDDEQDNWIVTFHHPNGDITEHFDDLDGVDDYLDRVFAGTVFRISSSR